MLASVIVKLALGAPPIPPSEGSELSKYSGERLLLYAEPPSVILYDVTDPPETVTVAVAPFHTALLGAEASSNIFTL